MPGKKLKCTIVDPKRVVLELVEPGAPGDQIDVTEIVEGGSSGLAEIRQALTDLQRAEIDKKLREQGETLKREWAKAQEAAVAAAVSKAKAEVVTSEQYQALTSAKTKYEGEIAQLNQRLQSQDQLYRQQVESARVKAVADFKAGQEYLRLTSAQDVANQRLADMEREQEAKIEAALAKRENELRALEQKRVDALREQSEKAAEALRAESQRLLSSAREEAQKSLEAEREKTLSVQKELDRVTSMRLGRSQRAGADLEKFLEGQFSESLGMLAGDCELVPQPAVIEGEKPDFEFIVYRRAEEGGERKKLVSVTIEAKNQASDGGKGKNSQHYAKLDRDRHRRDSQYSLLVSNLEPEDDFLIKRVNAKEKYENMFVCRPDMFVTFLSVIYRMYKSFEWVLVQEQDAFRFEATEKIRARFQELHDKVLHQLSDRMAKELEEIKALATDIQKKADKIIESAADIKEKHVDKAVGLIEKFRIDAVAKKIDKINAGQSRDALATVAIAEESD